MMYFEGRADYQFRQLIQLFRVHVARQMQGACQELCVLCGSALIVVRSQDRAKRALVRSRKAFQFAWSSSTESAPNFSVNASARTNATIASATTAAAGTAQTSLRSIAAGLSSI